MSIAMESPLVANFAADRDDNPSSIAKAVRVLRTLALAGDDADGVTHIAELSQLPKSTTHRVLGVLIDEGLVCRSSGQRYRLGPAWFELQSALSSAEWHRMVRQARRPLDTLFEQTDATVHFAVLVGDDVLYLEKLTAKGGTRVPTRVGERKPALCTALGKSLVAHCGDNNRVRTMLSKPLPAISPRSIRSPRILFHQLDQARQSGLSYDQEEVQPGVFCVAAPVFRAGKAIAAVSVTRVGGTATSQGDAVAVKRAAVDISRWMQADK